MSTLSRVDPNIIHSSSSIVFPQDDDYIIGITSSNWRGSLDILCLFKIVISIRDNSYEKYGNTHLEIRGNHKILKFDYFLTPTLLPWHIEPQIKSNY